MTYDAAGHRIRLVERTAGATPTITTTDFSYEGDRVVREAETTGSVVVTRTFTTDADGAIIKMTRTTTGGSTADDGTYLATWNGHGDLLGLARIDPTTGVLTPAARVTYSTWGDPAVTSVGTFGNLGFRYLYVGKFDVQSDDFAKASLLYMHARHYSPEFGRFLQPDPASSEANLYGYAAENPTSKADPDGRCTQGFLLSVFGGPEVGLGATVLCWTVVGVVSMLSYHPLQVLTQTLIQASVRALRSNRRIPAQCVVIGEGMPRVRSVATRLGCGFYGGIGMTGGQWYSVTTQEQAQRLYLNDNKRWLAAQMAQRKVIIDIGPSSGRDITHIYYWTEFTLTLGYPGRISAWGLR